MEGFTPVAGVSGGLLIGLGAVMLLLGVGRIAGISGIFANAITFGRDAGPRWIFIGGLLLGALGHQVAAGIELPVRTSLSWPVLAAAGLLVGIGTRLGGGCTSGHGVCGIGRLSARSIVATCVFMVVAIVTTYVIRHVIGLPT